MIKRDKIKAVIFDLDGTLIDSMTIWAQVDIDFLAKRGIEVPDDLFTNMPHGDGYRAMAQHFKDKFDLSDSVDEIMAEWTEMVHEFYNKLTLKDGGKELLQRLHSQGVILGIGTSNGADLTELVLNNNGIKHLFTSIITGCNIKRGKPFPDIYLEVAQNLKVEPVDCIVIEDTLNGVNAALNAEMKVIAIADDYSLNDKKSITNKADFYVNNHEELTNLLYNIK